MNGLVSLVCFAFPCVQITLEDVLWLHDPHACGDVAERVAAWRCAWRVTLDDILSCVDVAAEVSASAGALHRERERETERDRDRDRQTDRQADRQRHAEKTTTHRLPLLTPLDVAILFQKSPSLSSFEED